MTMELRDRLIKLASEQPEMRKHIIPILRESAELSRIARENLFDLEVGDIGLKEENMRNADTVVIYFPLSHIGKRGKTVEVWELSIGTSELDRTAWDATFMDTVKRKKPHTVKAMLDIWDGYEKEALEIDPKRWVRKFSTQYKGIYQDLPTPKSHIVKNIKGPDISIDLNAKPIEVYSKSYAAELDKGNMVYWYRIHPRFKARLMALAPELAAAKGINAVSKILNANKIPYDEHSYMSPGWD